LFARSAVWIWQTVWWNLKWSTKRWKTLPFVWSTMAVIHAAMTLYDGTHAATLRFFAVCNKCEISQMPIFHHSLRVVTSLERSIRQIISTANRLLRSASHLIASAHSRMTIGNSELFKAIPT
jgi:hypothetical protein